jgi:chemotaxis protein MotB
MDRNRKPDMPRRRSHDIDDNHERWLVSYADFVTLLFAFFVVMYAVSSINEGKYRVLSDSLVSAFRNIDIDSKGIEVTAPLSLPSVPRIAGPRRTVQQARAEERRRQAREQMRDMAGEIARILGPLVKDGRVRVTETALGVTVEINANVLFAVGDARLNPEALGALRAVAGVLAGTTLPVTVEGHTDDTPIGTAQFPSNWELSVVRASSVVRLFQDAGVSPRRLTATGYGEQRPVADNLTQEGRARNRRVSIQIEAPTVEEVSNEIPVELLGASGDTDVARGGRRESGAVRPVGGRLLG